ncbi:hypothetical protein [Flaviaesturariibacter terrae]
MRISLLLSLLLVAAVAGAQDSTSINAHLMLRLMQGRWTGVLQYRDYSSDRTVQIPAEVQVRYLGNPGYRIALAYDFPKEPGHGYADTIRSLPRQQKSRPDRFVVTRSSSGDDNGKPARLTYTYTFTADSLFIRKQVRLRGAKASFVRNEYRFARAQ